MRKFLLCAALAGCLMASPLAAKNMEHFSLGVADDVKTLDPMMASDTMSFSVALHMFEPLVNVDGHTKQLVPVLAEKWEMLDDHTYKFYLRHGVKFHNGEEMKASDVIFSVKRFAQESIFKGSTGKFIDPDGCEIVDDYTVLIRTKGPVGGFLENMKLPAFTICSEKAVNELGKEYFRNPVGTGPFKFVSWSKGDKLELEAFDDYWGEKPAFKKLSIAVLPDDSSRVIALETGKVDMIYMVPASDMDRINADGKAKVVEAPGLNLTYMGMNTQSPKLSDPRVRQAIEYAIDKNVYNAVVYQGHAAVPAGPLVPASTFTPKTAVDWSFNLEKAKKLMAEVGDAAPKKLTLWVSNMQERIDGATVIQSMLAQIGIQLDIQVFESSVFYDNLKSGKQELFISRWGMQTNRDSGKYWNGLFNSDAIGNTNDTRTNNPEIDKLINESTHTIDADARNAMFEELWVKLNDYQSIVPLAVANELYGGRVDLVGMENFCDGRLNYLGRLTLAD
nr:ABC transporter substrate-binding protein [Jonquetella anthropi]